MLGVLRPCPPAPHTRWPQRVLENAVSVEGQTVSSGETHIPQFLQTSPLYNQVVTSGGVQALEEHKWSPSNFLLPVKPVKLVWQDPLLLCCSNITLHIPAIEDTASWVNKFTVMFIPFHTVLPQLQVAMVTRTSVVGRSYTKCLMSTPVATTTCTYLCKHNPSAFHRSVGRMHTSLCLQHNNWRKKHQQCTVYSCPIIMYTYVVARIPLMLHPPIHPFHPHPT